jgi:transcriptional regulator with XRE-family HTH domain
VQNAETIIARGRARRALRADPAYARLVRLRAGLTQAEVGELLGVDRSAVARWEAGTRMPQGSLIDRYRDLLANLERAS